MCVRLHPEVGVVGLDLRLVSTAHKPVTSVKLLNKRDLLLPSVWDGNGKRPSLVESL